MARSACSHTHKMHKHPDCGWKFSPINCPTPTGFPTNIYCQLKCRLALLCGFPQKGFEDICWKNLSWASNSLILRSVVSIFCMMLGINISSRMHPHFHPCWASSWLVLETMAFTMLDWYMFYMSFWNHGEASWSHAWQIFPKNKHYNITPNKFDFWDCLTLPKTNSKSPWK